MKLPVLFQSGVLIAAAIMVPSHLLSAVDAPDSPRQRILFNEGWRFQKGDPEGAGDSLKYDRIKPWLLPTANPMVKAGPAARPEGPAPGEDVAFAGAAFDDSGWRKLDLPHDWGIEGPFQQDLPGETAKLPWTGVAWYRKSFDLPASDAGRRIELEIDGAMSFSSVWCNGRLVGGWPYGYTSYKLDMTPYLKPGARNTLAIRLENPEESSRWYPGGGIYRNVWLVKTSQVHADRWQTFVTTPVVGPASATVEVQSKITNDSAKPVEVRVTTEIFKLSSAGEIEGSAVAATDPVRLKLAPASTAPASAKAVVANPKLWDLQSPERYAAVTLVERDGRVVDRLVTPFGIRSIEFTADDGFHLNGKRVPLNGVCQHHDLGALGAAFNLRAAERQIEILKEMGCNAVRITHNPAAPELLDLFDRMGILAIAEFADTWTIAKKPNGYAKLFKDWSEADLRALVRRDRNHPSVIAWSIGNEIGEQKDPKNHPVAARLTEIAREEDPTRPTTAGCDFLGSGYNGFNKTVGFFGYNYKPFEYGKFRAANPDQPLYGSETASTISTRGEYLFPVTYDKSGGKIGFQMSSYDLYAPGWATPAEWEFKGQDENPSVAGEFVWTGFDYLGEPTPFNSDQTILTNYHTPEARAKAEEELKKIGKLKVPSRSSYFGIVDLAGFKKDRFYLYQARWRPDVPMAHILPHWNWPEREGEVTPVHVYTSGDEAELFLNGTSLGRKKKGNLEYRLRWDEVKYEPGELKVVAYKDGRKWAEDKLVTAGPAAKLRLSADRTAITADGRDLSFVTAAVLDANGNPVPRSSPKVKFSVSGPGEIVATDNGDPTDHTSFQSPERAAFNGLALAIVRAKPGADGPITLRVEAGGLAPAETVLNAGHP